MTKENPFLKAMQKKQEPASNATIPKPAQAQAENKSDAAPKKPTFNLGGTAKAGAVLGSTRPFTGLALGKKSGDAQPAGTSTVAEPKVSTVATNAEHVPAPTSPPKTFTEAEQIAELSSATLHDDQPAAYTPKGIEDIDRAFAHLVSAFDNRDAVAQALQHLMLSLQNNPEHAQILQPEDIGLMVRAVRRSYSVRIVKKQEKKTKADAKFDSMNDTFSKLLAERGLSDLAQIQI